MRTRAYILAVASMVVAASCGGSDESDSAPSAPQVEGSSASEPSADSTVQTAPSAPPAAPSRSDRVESSSDASAAAVEPSEALAVDQDLWQAYGQALQSGREVESFGSFDELVRSADQVAVGRVVDVTVGRLVKLADAPSSAVQFVVYWIEPTRGGNAVSFELPIAVSSPALEEAVQKAIQPHDADADGVLSDEELAASYDAEAVAAAYEAHWDEAVKLSVEDAKNRAPDVETVFLLRAVPTEGKFRPINGDSIIVNDAGQARAPWRETGEELPPVAVELASMSFDEVVKAVTIKGP